MKNSKTIDRLVVCLFAMAALLQAGCNDLPATVSGVVSVGGNPIPDGKIGFYPVAGGPPAVSNIGPDGKYEVRTASRDGLATGEYLVSVTSYDQEITMGMSQQEALSHSRVAYKYTSRKTTDLKANIVDGENDLPFDLEPPPKKPKK
ncbi:MAG: hypothetical protein RH917_03880 [Lacipirellulaceae bacterium]